MTTATLPAVAEQNGGKPKPLTPARRFRMEVSNLATSLLAEWVGDERAKEATGRIAAALAASAASAKKPDEFYACTIESVGTCIAVAALTGIMPGVGSTALAYVVPQRPRRGEAPQLQYSLSHRGLNALARRCGQTMVVIPVGTRDNIQSNSDGDVEVVSRDIDNPPTKFEELRGVMVIVKEIANGVVSSRGWVPRKLIEQRRAISRSFSSDNPQYSPWSTWPIEMAMKTAMHYAISRGWCVIDDTSAARAMTADVESDFRPFPDQQPLPALADGRSASDQIADMIEGKTADVAQDEQPQGEQESNATETGEESQEPDEFAPLQDELPGEHAKRLRKFVDEAASGDRLNDVMQGVETAKANEWISDTKYGELQKAYHARAKALADASKAGQLVG